MAKSSKLDKAIQAILQAIEPSKPTKPTKPAGDGDGVYCPSCKKRYPRSALVRRSWSGPGMKRPGGGPNGAWRETWRCCPKGHKLTRVSRKVS